MEVFRARGSTGIVIIVVEEVVAGRLVEPANSSFQTEVHALDWAIVF